MYVRPKYELINPHNLKSYAQRGPALIMILKTECLLIMNVPIQFIVF